MLRSLLAAGAALALVAPAAAQSRDTLTAGAWSCRMVSTVEGPSGDVFITFSDDGQLYLSMDAEMAVDEDAVRASFDMSGAWTLSDAVISSSVSDAEVINMWINEEEVDYDLLQEAAADLEEAFSVDGESRIAYMSAHALVLEEPDTSISCWR